MAARCKLPFALRPGLSQEDVVRTKEITGEKSPNKRENKGDRVPGVGRNTGNSSPAPNSLKAPSSSASALLSSSRSRRSQRSHSGTSLPASSSVGTSLPTSVAERKSNTAWLHWPSARRSRILHRLFDFPLSFRTSSHRIFY